MFIDIHTHTYLYPCPPQDGRTQFCTPEQVLARYDELGIDKGIILPLIGPEEYLPQSNQEVLEICRKYPDRFIPFCNIDPRGIHNSEQSDFTPWPKIVSFGNCLRQNSSSGRPGWSTSP